MLVGKLYRGAIARKRLVSKRIALVKLSHRNANPRQAPFHNGAPDPMRRGIVPVITPALTGPSYLGIRARHHACTYQLRLNSSAKEVRTHRTASFSMTGGKAFVAQWGVLGTGWISSEFTQDLCRPLAKRNVQDVSHALAAVGSRDKSKAEAFVSMFAPEGGVAQQAGLVDFQPAAHGSYQDVVNDPVRLLAKRTIQGLTNIECSHSLCRLPAYRALPRLQACP